MISRVLKKLLKKLGVVALGIGGFLTIGSVLALLGLLLVGIYKLLCLVIDGLSHPGMFRVVAGWGVGMLLAGACLYFVCWVCYFFGDLILFLYRDRKQSRGNE